MIDGQKCGDCIHFYPSLNNEKLDDDNDKRGQCRCDPPQLVMLVTGGQDSFDPIHKKIMLGTAKQSVSHRPMFPTMLYVDPGCGEFGSIIGIPL